MNRRWIALIPVAGLLCACSAIQQPSTSPAPAGEHPAIGVSIVDGKWYVSEYDGGTDDSENTFTWNAPPGYLLEITNLDPATGQTTSIGNVLDLGSCSTPANRLVCKKRTNPVHSKSPVAYVLKVQSAAGGAAIFIDPFIHYKY